MAAAQTQHRGIGRVPGGGRWVVVVLLVAAAVRLGRSRGEKEPVERYETVAVTRGPVEAKVMATGTLSAPVTVQVGSQVSGRVAELLVDFNDTVRKGQVVARIDPGCSRRPSRRHRRTRGRRGPG
jgi:HlyD family secretion protein